MATIIKGGCACGVIRFSAESHPWVSLIGHCESCRRVAAAPVTARVTFDKKRFKIVQGQPPGFSSSPSVWRTFCSACGTPLTYPHTDDPATVDVTSCRLDKPEAFPPTHHAWLRDDLSWLRFADGLAAYAEESE
jgi:hypothetical protein